MSRLLQLFTKPDYYQEYKDHCKTIRARMVGKRYTTNEVHFHLVKQKAILNGITK